jgi:DNA invertase Pin-like site-specific DNA recombinase/DNA-binding transcriptional MerR regulator
MSEATSQRSNVAAAPPQKLEAAPEIRNANRRVMRSEKILDHHLDRLAMVYVRQSTQHQVLEHRESAARQYALTDRAEDLGWSAQRVEVIDDDQGVSGSSIVGREGFQRLLSEISADRVGIVLGLEMSRFARSCKDWHTLLELCAIYRVLLADADGLYDPANHNDRLLLGLKGTMSEAELHILKTRMHQGMWNKAERGEVLNHPPIGYLRSVKARDGQGDYVIDPDAQVQEVVRMVFEQFERLGSINALLRWMVRHNIQIPVRPHFGSDRGELTWRRPNRVTLCNMLHHPIYAGAYRWGHREVDARKKIAGRPMTGRTLKSHEDCRVLIRDRFEAYIDWETFERIQQKLRENSHLGTTRSAPRHGPSVLSGLVICGRCGHRMLVQYANVRKGNPTGSLRYSCQREAIDYGGDRCQSLSGESLEAFVIERLLQVVQPASLEVSLAAVGDLEQERARLQTHWQQRRSRCAHEVEVARKSYAAVDPEHRLVAQELERRWDESLREQEQLEMEYARFDESIPTKLTTTEREAIESLSQRLPTLWQAETTTAEDRSAIARILIEQVVVSIEGESERVDVDIHWTGGFGSHHAMRRPVQTYEQLSYYDELLSLIKTRLAEGVTLSKIADQLNEAGYQPPKRSSTFTQGILSRLLRDRGIRTGKLPKSVTQENHLGTDEWWLNDLASELKMPIATLHRWQRVGWLSSRKVKQAGGRWAIYADADELSRLRSLRTARRGWPDPYPRELITPKPNPNLSNASE